MLTADCLAQWPSEWRTAAERHDLDPALLYAAALGASGQASGGHLAPWPWTLSVAGRSQHYASKNQAARALQSLMSDDSNLVGQKIAVRVGLMSIPLERFPSQQQAADRLDPATNLEQGASILALALRNDPSIAGVMGDAKDLERIRTVANTINAYAAARPTQSNASPASFAACAPPEKRQIAEMVEAAARRHGVDPAFALAVATRESALRQAAVSPKGARGVMQLMPGTAARYGADAADLAENIDAGTRYLRDLAELFGSDPRLVAAGYNAGEGAVLRHARQIPPYPETRGYVPSVLATRQELNRCATAQ